MFLITKAKNFQAMVQRGNPGKAQIFKAQEMELKAKTSAKAEFKEMSTGENLHGE